MGWEYLIFARRVRELRVNLSRRTFARVYRLLDEEAPLPIDCGLLCGRACCKASGNNLGIYLLPGEERLFSGREDWLEWEVQEAQEYDFPPSWRGKVYFLKCTSSTCPRQLRPMQCRSFPLAPHLGRDGRFKMIWETLDLPYRCPLLETRAQLQPGFLKALCQAWSMLLRDNLIRDLVEMDSRQREAEGKEILALYQP